MNTENNRLWRENEQRIISATMALMYEHEGKLPTVTAICHKAGINRSTFYAHFDNVTDLIQKHSLQLHDERTHDSIATELSFREPNALPLLQSIRDNAEFFRDAVFNDKDGIISSMSPSKKLEAVEQLIRPVCAQAGLAAEEEVMLFSVFVSEGFIGVIRRWLENECSTDIHVVSRVLETCLRLIGAGAKVFEEQSQH